MSKNKKLSYTAADVTVLDFDSTDVITTSGTLGDGWNNEGQSDPFGWT